MMEIYSYKEEKGPYTNNVEKIDPVGTAEYVEKADREQVNLERRQAREPVGNEEVIAHLADKPIVLGDNGLLFKNKVDYA